MMAERSSRIATSIRLSELASRHPRSRSSSVSTESKSKNKALARGPQGYTNHAISVESLPKSSSRLSLDELSDLSSTVQDAVRKAVQGRLQDLQDGVGKIHRTLSDMALKMTLPKRIAIIGAGPCGLTAAKCCLEEKMEVVVFDRTSDLGGLWCYRESDECGVPSVMKSTIINTSKEMSAFSDFPPPSHFPNFMHNTLMNQYFQMYADHFGVTPRVQLRTEVIQIVKSEDYDRTGRWCVTTKNLMDEKIITEEFEGVLLATGHHSIPRTPEFPGLRDFKGKVYHTHSLKKCTGFEDKTVLVVGIGNSAVDAAVEITTVAKQVYLSTRRGAWVFHRVGKGGAPYDASYITRAYSLLYSIVPFRVSSWFMERDLNKNFDHATYAIKPKHRVFSQHPTINDALANRILSGTIILREDIQGFTEHGAIFGDGTLAIDAVVLATGYDISFPLVDEDVIQVQDNKVKLYKYMFPPHLQYPSLAVVGCVQVWGALFPSAEAQCRWYAQLMSGKKKLPGREEMMRDIEKKEKAMAKRYVNSPRHTVQVDYIPYLDEIAKKVGCKPKLYKLFFTDPKVFWTLLMGPSVPYQYRLHGPHRWPEARDAILNSQNRVKSALKTRKCSSEKV